MKNRPIFILLKGILVLLFLWPSLTFGQNFSVTVNATDDDIGGRCTNDHCNYREALDLASGFQGPMFIFFDIPGTGSVRRIELTNGDLPEINNFGVPTLDATTQSDGAQVIIDGNNSVTYGLDLESADNTNVLGLTFDNFRIAGIYIGGASDACAIGTPNGGNTFSNSRYGLLIDGTNVSVQNNTFRDNDIIGVYADGDGSSATVGEEDNPTADNIFIGQWNIWNRSQYQLRFCQCLWKSVLL